MATLTGNIRANSIDGTERADLIDGRGGNDTLDGKGGNDRVLGGAGDDGILGGNGRDELRGGVGDDDIADTNGRNRVLGEAGDDDITASGFVDGGAGNDTIQTLFRESTIIGGSGADTFSIAILFGTAPTPDADNADLITDFDRREGDRIDVSFATIDTGLDAVTFVGTGPLTGDAQARFEVRGGDTFVLVNNADFGEPVGTPDTAFRLDGVFRLTADDFVLA
jgi:Ca2+-binding RTX toxin-like protein